MPTLRKNFWLWAALVLTLSKIWLTRGQAIYAISNAYHDDRLFLELANHILRGDWLGPYNQFTLAKGPLYSVFIAGTFLLGLPLGLAQQLIYAAACATVVHATRPLFKSAAAGFAAYTLLLWNPLTYEGESMTRLLRQHILVPLVLLVAAGLIALLLRRSAPIRARLPWAVLLGLALGGVWITREETVWILSIVAVLGSAIAIHAGRGPAGARTATSWLAALTGFCFALPVLTVCALNFHYYGWFGTVEFRSGDFKDAYGALTRVQVGPAYSNVPVSREMRAAIYGVSPAFAELQPYFEGPEHPWADDTLFAPTDHQILGGWFMWALRDAVAHAGQTHSAREALAYYRRIADEVNQACADGRLPARPPRSGFLPPWHSDYLKLFRAEIGPFARYYLGLPNFEARAPNSIGTDTQLQLFRELTHDELSPSLEATYIELPKTFELNRTRLETLTRIGRTLLNAIFGATLLAASITGVRLVQCLRKREFPDAFVIALGAWSAFLGAFSVSLLVHVSSLFTRYPAIVAPAYCFLPLAIIFTAADAFHTWRDWCRQNLRRDSLWSKNLRATLARHSGWLLATGAAGVVLAARLREIHLHADDLANLDQWKIAGAEILRPWVHGSYTLADFFHPHHEQLPIWTHVGAWLEVTITGRWDPLVQMSINAACFAGFVGLFAHWLRRSVGYWPGVGAVLLLVTLGASPHAWENTTWGFQSQFPVALLCLLLHVTGSFSHRLGTHCWWLAQFAGLVGLFTLDSLWAAPLAVASVSWWTGERDRLRSLVSGSLVIAGLAALVWIRSQVPPGEALAPTGVLPLQFVSTWLMLLGWPITWFGGCVLLNLPVMLRMLQLRGCARATPVERATLALGLWAMLQGVVIASMHNGEYSDFVSRHGDLLAVGVVANALVLAQAPVPAKWARVLLGLVWTASVAQGVQQVESQGHPGNFHHHETEPTHQQQPTSNGYLASGESSKFAEPTMNAIPKPASQADAQQPNESKFGLLLQPASGPSVAGMISHRLQSGWATLGAAAALAFGVGALAARPGREQPPATTRPEPDIWRGRIVAGIGLAAGGLFFLWPVPLEFRPDRRREDIINSAEAVTGLRFHFAISTSFPADRLTGGAGIPNESLRNLFFGTHVDGPDDLVSAASDPFPIAAAFLIVPFAGSPRAPGNGLLVRVSDEAGHTLAELPYVGTNPRDIGFWNVDLQRYQGRQAQLVLLDHRADSWVAVAPPRFSNRETAAAALAKRWELERSTPARQSLLAITGSSVLWCVGAWIQRRRRRRATVI